MYLKELVLLKINLCNIISFSSRREIFGMYDLSSAGTFVVQQASGPENGVLQKPVLQNVLPMMHRNDLDIMKPVAPLTVYPVCGHFNPCRNLGLQ
jgi:hypothetical protein